MKTSNHVRALSDALVQAAEVGDGHSRQTAQRLVGAIDPALQLETLSMAVNLADEVNRLTDAVRVDVVMTTDGPDLRVSTVEPHPAQEPIDLPLTAEAAEEETARVTLRIPASVKSQADAAAGAAGRSLNAWIIGAMRSALAAHQTNQSHSGGRSFAGRTSNGVGGSLRGWVS